MLALVTGMRCGELLGLKWSDVNFAEGVISVRRSLVELKGEGIIESEPKILKGHREFRSCFCACCYKKNIKYVKQECAKDRLNGKIVISSFVPLMVRRLRLRTCALCSRGIEKGWLAGYPVS